MDKNTKLGDITLCMDKCRRKSCPRHKSRIAFPNIPHSFDSFKNTAECPKTREESTKNG